MYWIEWNISLSLWVSLIEDYLELLDTLTPAHSNYTFSSIRERKEKGIVFNLPGIFLNIPWNFFDHSPESSRAFPSIFTIISRNILEHSPEISPTFPGILYEIPLNPSEHPRCFPHSVTCSCIPGFINSSFCILITSSYIDFYSTSFSFLQISSSLWRNWDNRTNDAWGGFLWKSISLNKIFSFWKLKISFTEMFHESLKKQFNWNLMLRYTVKLTLN